MVFDCVYHYNQAVVGYLRDKIRKEIALVFLDSLFIVVSTEKKSPFQAGGEFFCRVLKFLGPFYVKTIE